MNTTAKSFDAATSVLAEAINQKQAELCELEAAYELLGGTYEMGEASQQEAPKQLPAPAASPEEKAAVQAYMLWDKALTLTGRQAQMFSLLREAMSKPDPTDRIVGKDQLQGLCGGSNTTLYKELEALRAAVATAKGDIKDWRGLGYELVRA